MCNRVYAFCEKYGIFNDSQNGFRKHRSTTLAVYKFIQEALNIINNKKYAIGLLLDMTKAYDKVQYQILLDKLYGIGIRGKTHEWFKSYLENRTQYVEVEYFNNKTKELQTYRSDSKTVSASIPQGSVSGCLLFLVYINDLPKTIEGAAPCVLFADDISIITPCHDITNIESNLKNILTQTITWMNAHNLEINFEKTKTITFHPHQKKPLRLNFSFNNHTIEQVNEFTLLGITLDTNINWKSHVLKIQSKLSKFLYALGEVKKTTDLKTALTIYYAYAHAWLNYGIIMWGNSTDAPTLFTTQKKLIRTLVNIEQTDSCKPHFIKLNILTLPSLYILEICKFAHIHKEFYTTREDIQTRCTLRHKTRLNLPSSRLQIHSSSPLVMSIKIYNKLPETLRNEKKIHVFTSKLKKILISKCYYNVKEYLDDKNII